ncbi:MAG: NAD(P)/FAD-dependent oxidoreductase [Frankiaceae bacterium]
MRVVVVGAGVIGMLTALECAAVGAEVTVVDRAEVPNPRGASYDRHRAIRALYPSEPGTTRIAVAVDASWTALERSLGARVYQRVGALTALPPAAAAAACEVLADAGAPCEALDHGALTARYPQVNWPAGIGAVHEPRGGVVLADLALHAIAARLAAAPRCRLLARCRVVAVDAVGGGVRLEGGEELHGDAVLVAGGPWSRELVPADVASRLTLYRQTLLYCTVPQDRHADWAQMPVMPALGTPEGAWLQPPVAGTPLKLSAAAACRPVEGITDFAAPRAVQDILLDAFAPLIGGFDPGWVVDARDAYYLAATAADGAGHAPLLSRIGERAWAFAGCGGSSFKMAPLLARELCALATGIRRDASSPVPLPVPSPTGRPEPDAPRRSTAPEEAHR